MSYKEDFSRLEALVEKLLAQVDSLRRQNSDLQTALDSRGAELDKMQNETGNLQEERGEILSRVNRLIEPAQCRAGTSRLLRSPQAAQLVDWRAAPPMERCPTPERRRVTPPRTAAR